jgi:hypothetical protein
MGLHQDFETGTVGGTSIRKCLVAIDKIVRAAPDDRITRSRRKRLQIMSIVREPGENLMECRVLRCLHLISVEVGLILERQLHFVTRLS